MLELFKRLGTPVHTQRVIGKIKSRDLSKEEKKVIYRKDYLNSNPIEDTNTIVNSETYSDFIRSEGTIISVNVLQVDKITCHGKINDFINNPNYYKITFSNKLNDKQFSELKEIEAVATKMSKKHPVNFTAVNDKYIAQSSYTKGEKEVKINYNVDQEGITITKCLISNNNITTINKVNTRHLSIVELRSKPAYDLNTAILETSMFKCYILTSVFDVESITDEKDKLLIKDVMANYDVDDSTKLVEKIKEEFHNQKFIFVNDEVSLVNQSLNLISKDDIIKNRYNKPSEYGLDDLLDDFLKN